MTTIYVAMVNVPGYLPVDDEVHRFHESADAWAFLIERRERDLSDPMNDEGDGEDSALDEMEGYQDDAGAVGTVYGRTPGYDGDHDLGLAYTVQEWGHAGYPHVPGYLYDCEACEHTCHCTDGGTVCVHCALCKETTCADDECARKGH